MDARTTKRERRKDQDIRQALGESLRGVDEAGTTPQRRRIIATGNRASLDPEKLHAWIEEHRSDARLARAKLPFLATPEQAGRAPGEAPAH